jgi:hypothetical protein
MPTCNLLEIVNDIWLQQSGKRGAYLYVATSNDYVQTFKPFPLYYVFLLVVPLRLDQIGMSCDCIGPTNLVILHKWW